MKLQYSKTIFQIFVLFCVFSLPSSQIIPIHGTESRVQQSFDLIAKISNISIGNLALFGFNISFEYQIYNPSQYSFMFIAYDPCGLTFNVTMTSYEGSNVGINYIENACPGFSSSVMYSPGLTIQYVYNATILLSDCPKVVLMIYL